MTALDNCPKCGAALAADATICAGCGWDATIAVVNPPRSLLRLLTSTATRVVLYGVILAVPVSPPGTAGRLARECDEVVVLATPEPFIAVGRFYQRFEQVTDEQVIAALEAASSSRSPGDF